MRNTVMSLRKIGGQDVIASLSRSQSFKVEGSGKEDPFPKSNNRAFSFAVVAILLQQSVGQEFSFPRLQTHEQPVLACFRKLSSPVDGNKASERQNAKSSLHCKLETPLAPQNSLQPARNSWPEITTLNVIFSLKIIRKPSLETLDVCS